MLAKYLCWDVGAAESLQAFPPRAGDLCTKTGWALGFFAEEIHFRLRNHNMMFNEERYVKK